VKSSALFLPGNIQELITRKIGSLSELAREALSLASCIGRDIESSLVVQILSRRGLTSTDVRAALRECVDHGMLAAAEGGMRRRAIRPSISPTIACSRRRMRFSNRSCVTVCD
jgi:hypothetical protein